MTLPSSGAISFAQINAELKRPVGAALSLNDADVRLLAQVPSGAVSLANLYGKTWLTAADAVAWYSANRDAAHNWGQGGSGDTRAIGGPYERYTASSSWTFNCSFSGVTSTWTTIVVAVSEGGVYNIRDITINGGAYQVASSAVVYNANQQAQVVVHVNTDIKNITSVYFAWDHASGNYGTWPAATVIPGKWGHTAITPDTSVAVPAFGILIGTDEAGGDGPFYGLNSVPSGCAFHNFTAWWYNCCQHYMVANNTSGQQTVGLNYTDEVGRAGLYSFIMG
jgi:hypothetical protein